MIVMSKPFGQLIGKDWRLDWLENPGQALQEKKEASNSSQLDVMAVPTDPLYYDQWHFGLIGDIETIWDEYDGNGVHVAVYDSAIEYDHPDFDANLYDSSLHFVDSSGKVYPSPTAPSPHSRLSRRWPGSSRRRWASCSMRRWPWWTAAPPMPRSVDSQACLWWR